MTRPALSLAAAFGALCLVPAPALAQDQPPPPGLPAMVPVSLDQIPAWVDALFARLDVNQDEAVTGDELAVLSRGPAAAMGGRLRRMIAQSDASNDGRITRDEMTAGAERMFRRMDVNGDGVLTGDELPRMPPPDRPPAIPMPAPEPMPMPDMD